MLIKMIVFVNTLKYNILSVRQFHLSERVHCPWTLQAEHMTLTIWIVKSQLKLYIKEESTFQIPPPPDPDYLENQSQPNFDSL